MRKILRFLPAIPLLVAGVIAFAGIQGYQQGSRSLVLLEPEVKSLDEAARASNLIVIGRAVKVGETLMENTLDGWDRPVTLSSRHTTPYTDFRVEVTDVVYADPDWSSEKEVLFRVVGGASVIVEPDVDHLDNLRDGESYVFFLRRSWSPYDTDTWRPVDSVHIFPVQEGRVLPNNRSLKWNVATINSPLAVSEFKVRVNRTLAGATPEPGVSPRP